jgi:RNA polymerase subunit RPABC4/transcription elongation factor Spt4
MARPVPSRTGGTAPPNRRWIQAAGFSLLVLTLLVVSAVAGPSVVGLPSSASSPGAAPRAAGSSPSYGDLIVASGQTTTIQGPSAGGTYFQAGNITVDAGGTLIVENTTISFVQYVTDGTTLAQQLAHIYRFTDAGTVEFINSGLTTDVNVLNFSAKLFVSVTGTLTAWNSTFAFPGWIEVTGPGALASFNDSTIEANPGVVGIYQNESAGQPWEITNDTRYAPTLNVTGGAQLDLFGSTYADTYSDNLTQSGSPTALPIVATGLTLPTTGATYPSSDFTLPATASWQVAEAALYPSEATDVGVTVSYTTSTGTGDVGVNYGGTTYTIGSVNFAMASPQTVVAGPDSPLVQAMMASGLPLYLAGSVVFLHMTTAASMTVGVAVNMTPATNYNVSVWGSGSRLDTVDSAIDINFAPSYLNITTPAFPWSSNKLTVRASAQAYLGNLTTPERLPANSSSSAILTDGTGTVYLYRWAEFNIQGQDDIHVAGAAVRAFYAYPSSQANNATANAANDLATAAPSIWSYLSYWDAQRGIPSYGTSTVTGQAFLLLASSEVNGSTLPNGNFLGDYHIEISVAASGLAPIWSYASVSPYPAGVANHTPGYDMPDVQPLTSVTGYFGAATLNAPVILANGTATVDSVVREGQRLGVELTLVDQGTARIFNVNASLFWNRTLKFGALDNFTASDLNLTAVGDTLTFNLTWVINDTITGLRGNFTNTFFVALSWNYGVPRLAGGVLLENASVVIAPSEIRIVSLVPPSSPLDTSNSYITTGVIAYNGSQPATIVITATPVGGGTQVQIAAGSSFPGKFEVVWFSTLSSVLTPGTTYSIEATATYNGASTTYLFPGTYSVPSTTSTSGFLFQKVLGLPLWIWLVIAAAIVVGIVAALLVFRRQAAGKLVECGECGELIPADATVCPHCGAVFETDVVRCSRCSATIPASSEYCPECGAQLLGKPGSGESDPERQAYADFTERFRAEAKKELGDNYTESAFWDWWKRQPTYVPFSQWKAQQAQGAPRTGMSQPPAGSEMAPPTPPGPGAPPSGGAGGAMPPPGAAAAPLPATSATAAPPPPAAPPTTGLKPCPSCGKEIPPEYLVCPFCGAVTQ